MLETPRILNYSLIFMGSKKVEVRTISRKDRALNFKLEFNF